MAQRSRRRASWGRLYGGGATKATGPGVYIKANMGSILGAVTCVLGTSTYVFGTFGRISEPWIPIGAMASEAFDESTIAMTRVPLSQASSQSASGGIPGTGWTPAPEPSGAPGAPVGSNPLRKKCARGDLDAIRSHHLVLPLDFELGSLTLQYSTRFTLVESSHTWHQQFIRLWGSAQRSPARRMLLKEPQ